MDISVSLRPAWSIDEFQNSQDYRKTIGGWRGVSKIKRELLSINSFHYSKHFHKALHALLPFKGKRCNGGDGVGRRNQSFKLRAGMGKQQGIQTFGFYVRDT